MIGLFFWIAQSWAQEGTEAGAHAANHAIPWHTLFVQAFNFLFLFGFLFFVLRKTVAAHFENRAREYQQLVERAEAAKAEAERGKVEIEKRLATLQSGAEQSVAQARADAEQLKKRMIEEGRALAEKLEQEAKRTAAVELEKAKAELRCELLSSALNSSSETLRKTLSSSEQKKLQNEFVEKIQVVTG